MYLLTDGSTKDYSINTFKKMNPLPSLISLSSYIVQPIDLSTSFALS
jgi:hypothetical protein